MNYSLVFWLEKLNGDVPYTTLVDKETYNTLGKLESKDKVTVDQDIVAPDKVSAAQYIPELSDNAQNLLKYAEFSHADAAEKAHGDGSSVVNVYYNLIDYTFNFDLTPQTDRIVTGMGVTHIGRVTELAGTQSVNMSGLHVGTDASTGAQYSFKAKYGENLASKWPIVNGSAKLVNQDGSDRQVDEAWMITYPYGHGLAYKGSRKAYVFDYSPISVIVSPKGVPEFGPAVGKTYDINGDVRDYSQAIQGDVTQTDKVDFLTWSDQGAYYDVNGLQSNWKYVPSVTSEIVANASNDDLHTVTLTPIFSLADTDYGFEVKYQMENADDNGVSDLSTDNYLSTASYFQAKVIQGGHTNSSTGFNWDDTKDQSYTVRFDRIRKNVYFDLNDKTGGDVDKNATLTYKYQEHLKNQAFPKDPVRTGYTFGGWYLDSNCIQPFIDKTGNYAYSTMPGQDVTLYAKWTRNDYHVYYFADYATYLNAVSNQVADVAPTETVATDTYKTDTRLALPSESFDKTMTSSSRGIFDRWNIMQGNSAVSLSDGYAVNNDLYVFASYQTVKFTVSYDGIDSNYSGPVADDKSRYGYETSIKLDDAPTVLKTNADKVFMGWTINGKFFLPGDFAQINSSIAPNVDLSSENQTLHFVAKYAKQTQIASLNFHPNLSDLEGRDTTVKIPVNTPTKLLSQDYFNYKGLTLAGWRTKEGKAYPVNAIYTAVAADAVAPVDLFGIWYADAALDNNQKMYDGSNIKLTNKDLISGEHVKLSNFDVTDFDWQRDGKSVALTDLKQVGSYTYTFNPASQRLALLEQQNGNIDFSKLLTITGHYNITKMPVTVTVQGPTIVYDGVPRTVAELLENKQIKVGYQDGKGNEIALPDGSLALEVKGEDSPVTDAAQGYRINLQEKSDVDSQALNQNYDISFNSGSFNIDRLALSFSLTSSGKVYDGKSISYRPIFTVKSTNAQENQISDPITLSSSDYQITPLNEGNKDLKNPGTYLIRLNSGINQELAGWYQKFLSKTAPLVVDSGASVAQIQEAYLDKFGSNFELPTNTRDLMGVYLIQGIPATGQISSDEQALNKFYDGKSIDFVPTVTLSATEPTFDTAQLEKAASGDSIVLNDAVNSSSVVENQAQKLLNPVGKLAPGDYEITDRAHSTGKSHIGEYTIRLTAQGIAKIVQENPGFIFDQQQLQRLKLPYLITDSGVYAVPTQVQLVDIKTGKPVKTLTIVGEPGHPTDVDDQIPNGYQVVPGQSTKVTVPDKPGIAKVSVYQTKSRLGDPINAVTTTVEIVDNKTGQPVKTLTIVGEPGHQTNINNQIPNGYQVVPGQNTEVTNPDKPGTVTVNVYQKKTPMDNPVYAVTATVKIVDNKTGQPLKTLTIVGEPGHQTDVNNQIPNGYQVVPGQSTEVTNPSQPGTVTVNVYQKKTPVDNPVYAVTTTVKIVDNKTGQPIKTLTIVTNPHHAVDVSTQIPNGYRVVPSQPTTVDVPERNSTITVPVEKNVPADWDPIEVIFITPNGNKVTEHVIQGKIGDHVDISQFIPSGYHLTTGESDQILLNEITPQYITIEPDTTTVPIIDGPTGVDKGVQPQGKQGLQPKQAPKAEPKQPNAKQSPRVAAPTGKLQAKPANFVRVSNKKQVPTKLGVRPEVQKAVNSSTTTKQMPKVAAPAGQQTDKVNKPVVTDAKQETTVKHQLPQTSESQTTTVWSILGAMMASVLSLFGLARRKRQD